MSETKKEIEKRPNYYNTQLLREDDFLAEQDYHINARRRHSAKLHGWGVVDGLTISRESAQSIIVHPGFAVDKLGNEISLESSHLIDLAEFRPNERLKISLGYEVERRSKEKKRLDCYAVFTVSEISDQTPGVILATVQLDGQGRLGEKAISYIETNYAKRIAPGSITSTELDESLKKGWLRLPFRPIPIVRGPEKGSEEGLPAFRVGTTLALSPDPKDAGQNDRGAAGTMAIPIPPGAKQVIHLRIAGQENEGEILLELIVGGWDPHESKHVHKIIVEKTIKHQPFLVTFKIDETTLDPEYHTLSLWLKGTRRTAISLVAVEFVY